MVKELVFPQDNKILEDKPPDLDGMNLSDKYILLYNFHLVYLNIQIILIS